MNLRRIAGRISIWRGWAAATALLIASLGFVPRSFAYSQYSQTGGGDGTNCAACHGDFRSPSYISPRDHQNWGNIHDLHRWQMLNGDCSTCHFGSGRFPVYLEHSNGGSGLDPISCVGCHGRAEDNVPGNPEVGAGRSGYGAGLRQHHYVKGVTVCGTCHLDANPASYVDVGENVLPVYYAHPGISHPAMPTDPCNTGGNENFAGAPEGLDNDGDAVYDGADTNCSSAGVQDPDALAASGLNILPNSPNPFTGGTSIEYEISKPSLVEIRIVDVHGRSVRQLSSPSTPGRHRISWDGRDDGGRDMASGLYFCELRSNGVRVSRAMVLIR